MTPTMSTHRSNQLSYAPNSLEPFVEYAPGRTRTPNLLVRSQTLYPIELRALTPPLHVVAKCPRQDSNLYAVSDTGPSNQPVYKFQHVGIKWTELPISSAVQDARGGTRTLTGLTPTGS